MIKILSLYRWFRWNTQQSFLIVSPYNITSMTFGKSIQTCFSKYLTFNGRATRSEFWWFWFLSFLVNIPFNVWGFALPFYTTSETLVYDSIMMSLLCIVALVLIFPMISVFVRRMHDTGRSGWNFLWSFLPFIGGIILLIFLLQPSAPSNKYGMNPNEIPEIDEMDL